MEQEEEKKRKLKLKDKQLKMLRQKKKKQMPLNPLKLKLSKSNSKLTTTTQDFWMILSLLILEHRKNKPLVFLLNCSPQSQLMFQTLRVNWQELQLLKKKLIEFRQRWMYLLLSKKNSTDLLLEFCHKKLNLWLSILSLLPSKLNRMETQLPELHHQTTVKKLLRLKRRLVISTRLT